MATAATIGTTARAALARYRQGRPAANTMTATIASRATELPKSGWNMMRASIGTRTTTIGPRAYFGSPIRSMRRSSTAAANRMTASLASSDGWMPTPATANQRWVPLISGPTIRTATSASNVKPTSPRTRRGSR